jgi:dynein heavy chain
MRDAYENCGVVEACTSEGREEILNGFNQDIETCEKALNAYLEEKKKVFPRFYFVSN